MLGAVKSIQETIVKTTEESKPLHFDPISQIPSLRFRRKEIDPVEMEFIQVSNSFTSTSNQTWLIIHIFCFREEDRSENHQYGMAIYRHFIDLYGVPERDKKIQPSF